VAQAGREQRVGRRTIRYRVYPTVEQLCKMREFFRCCRQAQNAAKEQRQMAWPVSRRSVLYTRQTADLKELRDNPELARWLSRVP